MNYYNDNDRQIAAWLRELIKEGLIAEGEVDERSIAEVKPEDLRGYTQCHFFAGIGGWSYALRLAGVPDDFPVWTGSCPCQPLSCAGKRRGHEDERHLWPAFFRLIRECRPAIVFGEQVDSKDGLEWLTGIQTDMENAGYAVACASLNAAGVSAPHIRQRFYWGARRLADTTRAARVRPFGRDDEGDDTERLCQTIGMAVAVRVGRRGGRNGHSMGAGKSRDTETETARPGPLSVGHADADHAGLQGRNGAVLPEGSRQCPAWQDSTYHYCQDGKHRRIPPEPSLFPLADGAAFRLDRRRNARNTLLKGIGNAIVPQVAAVFIEAFLEAIEAEEEKQWAEQTR